MDVCAWRTETPFADAPYSHLNRHSPHKTHTQRERERDTLHSFLAYALGVPWDDGWAHVNWYYALSIQCIRCWNYHNFWLILWSKCSLICVKHVFFVDFLVNIIMIRYNNMQFIDIVTWPLVVCRPFFCMFVWILAKSNIVSSFIYNHQFQTLAQSLICTIADFWIILNEMRSSNRPKIWVGSICETS